MAKRRTIITPMLFLAGGIALVVVLIGAIGTVFPLLGKKLFSEMDLGTDTRHIIAYVLIAGLLVALCYGAIGFLRVARRSRNGRNDR
jgi:hypothetical protein